ncbi:hypothetical protein [Nonomuraea maheshkhaliensis]
MRLALEQTHSQVLNAGLSRRCVIVVWPELPFELYVASETFESV